MEKQSALAHYMAVVADIVNPALRHFYKGEKSFEVNLDGIALTVHGWIEPAGPDGAGKWEPATVSINSVCWPGSELCVYELLSESAIARIQDLIDAQVERRN